MSRPGTLVFSLLDRVQRPRFVAHAFALLAVASLVLTGAVATVPANQTMAMQSMVDLPDPTPTTTVATLQTSSA
jgi:hypothetical protein